MLCMEAYAREVKTDRVMMARRTSFACCAMLICSCSFAEAFNSAYMSVPSVRFRGSFPQLLHTGRVRPCLTTRMADEGGILSKVSLPSLTQVETVDYDHPAHIPACPVSGCAKGLFCEQICYGALLYTSAQGLLSDALVGSFDRPVILDSFIFVVSLVLLRQTFAKVNYAKLDGLEVNSLARDAGDWALAGEVPLTSKDGKYQVATFAGGCFWGTELHFQRMPGVIATCVGYLAHSCVRACMFGVGPMIAHCTEMSYTICVHKHA